MNRNEEQDNPFATSRMKQLAKVKEADVPIGSTFRYNGKLYRVEPSIWCTDCAFNNSDCQPVPATCFSNYRADERVVVFVEVEEASNLPNPNGENPMITEEHIETNPTDYTEGVNVNGKKLPVIYICDTETSALGQNAEIIEIAWIKINPDPKEWVKASRVKPLMLSASVSRYKPTRKVNPRTTAIHGITDKMLETMPDISTLRIPADADIVICHNVGFDRWMLQLHYDRYDLEFPKIEWICTLQLAKDIQNMLETVWVDNGKGNGKGLNSLIHLFNFFYPDMTEEWKAKAHGALADCQMTAAILKKMLEILPSLPSFHELLDEGKVDD